MQIVKVLPLVDVTWTDAAVTPLQDSVGIAALTVHQPSVKTDFTRWNSGGNQLLHLPILCFFYESTNGGWICILTIMIILIKYKKKWFVLVYLSHTEREILCNPDKSSRVSSNY